MRRTFPDAEVVHYTQFLDAADNHPKDRHVASGCDGLPSAQLILTDNLRDFHGDTLADSGIHENDQRTSSSRSPQRKPGLVLLALGEMAARKTRPPMTVEDILVASNVEQTLHRSPHGHAPPPTRPNSRGLPIASWADGAAGRRDIQPRSATNSRI